MPLVSVVLSYYNTKLEYFQCALDSIINQTYENIEIIIIDDYSDQCIESIVCAQDKRIRVIRNPRNMGLAFSLNRGIDISNGKYIARMDTDDISLPTRIEEQVKYMERNKDVVVLGTRSEVFGDDCGIRAVIPESFDYIKAQFLFNVGITHPSVMIRKSYLVDNNLLYNTSFRKAQDYDLWTRICRSGGIIRELNKILLKYRISDTQASSGINRIEQAKYADLVRKKELETLQINATEKEYAIHECLSRSLALTEIDMLDVLKWCEKIDKQNRKTLAYDTRMLRIILVQRIVLLKKKNKHITKNSKTIRIITQLIVHFGIYAVYITFLSFARRKILALGNKKNDYKK